MSKEVIEIAYKDWKNAMMKGDIAFLDKVCTENFSWTNIMGSTHNKAENIYKVSSGNLRYISWINKNMSIDMAEDIAVVKTLDLIQILVYGIMVRKEQEVTVVFKKQNGK